MIQGKENLWHKAIHWWLRNWGLLPNSEYNIISTCQALCSCLKEERRWGKRDRQGKGQSGVKKRRKGEGDERSNFSSTLAALAEMPTSSELFCQPFLGTYNSPSLKQQGKGQSPHREEFVCSTAMEVSGRIQSVVQNGANEGSVSIHYGFSYTTSTARKFKTTLTWFKSCTLPVTTKWWKFLPVQ